MRVAMGAGATFVARSVDVFAGHLVETLERAAAHQGTAFIEVFQNCNIFNDGAWKSLTDKPVRDSRTIQLEHGKPLRFGTEDDPRGIVLDDGRAKVVQLGTEATERDLVVWDEKREDPTLAMALAGLPSGGPHGAAAIGVFRQVERPVFERAAVDQVERAKASKPAVLHDLLHAGDTWDVS